MNSFTKTMINASISTSIISLGIMVYLFNGDFAYSLAIAALAITVICLSLAWLSFLPLFSRKNIKGSKSGIFHTRKSGKSSNVGDKTTKKTETSILPSSSSESSTSSDGSSSSSSSSAD